MDDSRPSLSLLEPEDREAVLLEWEAKIETAERSPGARRFEGEHAEPEDSGPEVRADEDASLSPPEQSPESAPVAERRTVMITGRPQPALRRATTMAERQIAAQPDRIALWAFLLGLLLVAVAAGSAHA